MTKNAFKSQASSSRAASGVGFGGFGVETGSTLSYLTEPPNLSSISDANVVVEFKNLSKKDTTTKTKALEELKTYVQAHPHENGGGVEEPVLDAWIKFYPRLSIDNSRRVRELSHNLQYELLRSARKRMERYIPKIVGSWLAGMYDRDRVAAKAARDGIVSFLDTQAKVLLFWKRCHAQILSYAQEAMEETPETLSDERTMSADDVEAKYFRVIGSALSLVVNLLTTLGQDDIMSCQDKYEEFLVDNKKLWKFASCDDAFVRRTIDQMLIVCLDKQPQIIESSLEVVSHSFIAEALGVSQSSSALQLLQALNKLSVQFPHTWTTVYNKKTRPINKLRNFIQKGSQGGPPGYWRSLHSLIQNLPKSVLGPDADTAVDFLKLFRDGITNREEPRSNATEAWLSYVETASILAANCDQSQATKIFEDSLYPLFENFLYPTTEGSKWAAGSSTAVLSRGYLACRSQHSADSASSFAAEWQRLGDNFIARIQTSLPEQSKDYGKSQEAVTAEGNRWFALLADVQTLGTEVEPSDPLIAPSSKIIDAAIAVATSRTGKPYSAAAILDAALRLAPRLMEIHPASLEAIELFLETDLPKLILSPSSSYLVSILNHYGALSKKEAIFDNVWKATTHSLLSTGDSDRKLVTLTSLISNDSVANLSRADSKLQELYLEVCEKAIRGQENAWHLFEAAIRHGAMTSSTERKVVDEVIKHIDVDDSSTHGALKAVEIISKNKPHLLESEENVRVTFLAKMLSLAEVSDTNHLSRSAALKFIEDSQNTSLVSNNGKQAPIIHIIQENLHSATTISLSVDTLALQAKAIMETSHSDTSTEVLFPDTSKWAKEMRSLLSLPPNPSLAVMRPFAGAVFLVSVDDTTKPQPPSKDINGYSVPLRMAMYMAALVPEKRFIELTNNKRQIHLLYWLCITAELLSDQIDVSEAGLLFDTHSRPDGLTRIRGFLPQYQACLASLVTKATSWRGFSNTNGPDDTSHIIKDFIMRLIEGSNSSSSESFYAAKVLYHLLVNLVGAHGWASAGSDEWLSQHGIITKRTLGTLAVVTALHENLSASKMVSNQCNRLISDLATASSDSPSTLGLLVQLNSYLAVYDDTDLPVAQTRLVFGVQRILSWTENLAVSDPRISSEICRALQKLLPAMKEVYGSYWHLTVNFCISIWESEMEELSAERLPMIGMSLKLFSIVMSLQKDNEDISDALVEEQAATSSGLANLLKLRRMQDTVPLKFVDDLLSRLIVSVPKTLAKDVTEFYPLIASEFQPIQLAAYEIIHDALPEAQKEISINVLLDKRDARLPEELLSLLLDPPSIHNFSDQDLAEFPSSIRAYLFSWHLVYDSYTNASFKVRNDYSNILQSENYIEPLLAFLFDILGHSAAVPLNLDKAGFDASMIRSYHAFEATDTQHNERNMQWLAINIYYLCLTYTPNLVKTWWMDCKSKQTQLSVESWTEKYFSPLVIEDTMDEVSKWAESQESTSDEEKELIIKVSRKSRGVFAGYEVDDMVMQIVIRLPPNYPLASVKVEGINRVAATEKKWTSWLRITEGAIKFSNGSIIDGLTTFRKNVTGALKGQTECAICYSIVSADKKMPDKRCQTCKNLFHSACLFKWFTSSSQSTCPLCRNLFSFGVSGGRSRRGNAEG